MKKWLLTLAVLAILASPALAYVQSGHLLSNSQGNGAAARASRVPSWIESHGPLTQPGQPQPTDPTLDDRLREVQWKPGR